MHAPLHVALSELYARLKPVTEGQVASYIPELGHANPELFAACVTTVDGHQYAVGDAEVQFTIQSISKPFVYGLALNDRGVETVAERVSVEPSGEAFNAISLEADSGRPRNPMINAGAIATTSMVRGQTAVERFERIVDALGGFAGRDLSIDEQVYLSERATGHRNRAIAHLLRNANILDGDVDGSLDCYFKQCSVLVTCTDLSVMAATLANGGRNPLSGRQCLDADEVGNVLSVMSTCGMYDYAGSWQYRVGMPAKSGVSGGVVAVLPGQLGIGVFSPRLDSFGNSVRGVAVCEAFSREFGLHMLRPPVSPGASVLGSYTLADLRSQRRRSLSESRILEQQGRRVRILKLQGPLVMSTAEFALSRAVEDGHDADTLVIDFHRVHSLDAASRQLLDLFCEQAAEARRRIVFCGLNEDTWTPRVRLPVAESGETSVSYFLTLEQALESCEDKVLADAGVMSVHDVEIAPQEHPLLAQLTIEERRSLVGVLRRSDFTSGDRIIAQGEVAEVVYLLAYGTVAVTLGLPDGGEHRVATMTSGSTFGEMALMDAEPRTANVDAVTDVVCYSLDVPSLEGLEAGSTTRAKLIEQLAREMAARLRRADAEIAALAL